MPESVTATQRNAAVQSLGIPTKDLVETRWPLDYIECVYLVRDPDTGLPVFDGETARTRTEIVTVVPG
jgi:hypothetical protein